MSRTFGVEIECSVPFGGTDIQIRSRIADALNRAGVRTVTAQYSGRDYSVTQVKPDCSLTPSHNRGHRGTAEIVTRVLDFDNPADIRELQIISETLIGLGALINPSCGLHTHVSVANLTGDQLATFVETWHALQLPVTDDLIMRDQRRARNGGQHYAQPMSDYQITRMAEYARAGERQYFASCTAHSDNLNAQNYASRGTIEIRQQSGTVNWRKMIGWVGYLFGILAAIERGNDVPAVSTDDTLDYFVAADYLTAELREWAQGRSTSVNVGEANRAMAAAMPSMSRLMALQGMHA